MRTLVFNGGHCRQLQAMVDRRTWRMISFQAVFLAVRHPTQGWVLIDTGYSTHFREATRRWPGMLYRWITPMESKETTAETLRRGGVDPAAIQHIIITHFHGDHIGGLRDFPRATFHFRRDALEPLLSMRPFAQIRHAFPAGLLPDDFNARARPIDGAAFNQHLHGFPAHDLFGDGSFQLIPLPGHAPGQIGISFESQHGPLLYAADAFWDRRQVSATLNPSPIARLVMHDRRAYDETISQLRTLHQSGVTLLGCHCPHTQTYVDASSGDPIIPAAPAAHAR